MLYFYFFFIDNQIKHFYVREKQLFFVVIKDTVQIRTVMMGVGWLNDSLWKGVGWKREREIFTPVLSK